jgi:hypothetical protein
VQCIRELRQKLGDDDRRLIQDGGAPGLFAGCQGHRGGRALL